MSHDGSMAIPGTDPDDDFYQEDQPLADVLAAWDRSADGEHLTAPPLGVTLRLHIEEPRPGLTATLPIPDDLRSLEPLTEVPTRRGWLAA